MNRRDFLKAIGITAAAAPVVAQQICEPNDGIELTSIAHPDNRMEALSGALGPEAQDAAMKTWTHSVHYTRGYVVRHDGQLFHASHTN